MTPSVSIRPASPATTSRVTIRPSTTNPRLVHLRLRDDAVVPSADEIRRWTEDAATAGAAIVRTAALFPRAAATFEACGFRVADTLVLLHAELTRRAIRSAISADDRPTRGTTGTLRRQSYGDAARLDAAAFGAVWGHDRAELEDIRHATPVCRARCRYEPGGERDGWRGWFGGGQRGAIAAFAIAGASAEHGYLQRLSVDPRFQRRGHGRALTLDALRWMARRRLDDCLVNTSVDNEPAQALYQSIGFTPMADRLRVLELEVR